MVLKLVCAVDERANYFSGFTQKMADQMAQMSARERGAIRGIESTTVQFPDSLYVSQLPISPPVTRRVSKAQVRSKSQVGDMKVWFQMDEVLLQVHAQFFCVMY